MHHLSDLKPNSRVTYFNQFIEHKSPIPWVLVIPIFFMVQEPVSVSALVFLVIAMLPRCPVAEERMKTMC